MSYHTDILATDGDPTTKGTVVTVTARALHIETIVETTAPRARRSVQGREGGTVSAQAPAATQVTMVEPLAGFETDTDFTLTPIDEAGVLQSLRSVRDTDLRFVVSPAGVFFAAYRDSLDGVIGAPVATALGVRQQDAALTLYVLLTVGTSLKDTTANLRAPLVIDHATGRAVQVILDDDALPLRQPLPTA
jgi:flagellar assembly factor FliW